MRLVGLSCIFLIDEKLLYQSTCIISRLCVSMVLILTIEGFGVIMLCYIRNFENKRGENNGKNFNC